MKRLFILALLLVLVPACRSAGPTAPPPPFNPPNENGEVTYNYDSGELMLVEQYADGELKESRWYSPRGNLLYETRWVNGSGTGIYLNQDGTLRVRMEYRNGLAHGLAYYYDREGLITNIVEFHDGQPVGSD